MSVSVPANARLLGETFTCHFGRYGTVVIDSRETGATVTVRGHRYPIKGGSYFYQTDDSQIVLAFSSDMRRWTYTDVRDDPNFEGIEDRHCSRRANRQNRNS